MMILQAGSDSVTGSRDPKLGIVSLRLKCHAPTLAEAITGELPDYGVTGLVETQPREFGESPAGKQGGYDVYATVEGHTNPEGANEEDFSLETSLDEAPIESHRNISILLKLYNGKAATATARAFWPETLKLTAAQKAAGSRIKLATTVVGNNYVVDRSAGDPKNPMHGVESYLSPKLIWTRRWVSVTLPSSIASTVGSIDIPPGNPPEIGQGRNWLKIRVRGTYRGNIWQIEESWELSGPYGWVPEIYRYEG